ASSSSSTNALPLKHLSKPTLLWNQAIQSSPGNGNIVQISPDNKWLYITSSDGKLHKLDPRAGTYVNVFTPEKRREDGSGGVIAANAQLQWMQYGGEGISFHMDNDGSYLVYWVFDVPPPSTGLSPSSRVIAIKHDDSKGMEVLWTKMMPGTIQGTPVIGSEGKFIYFTMNSIPTPPTPPPTNPPTKSPVATPVITNSPITNTPSVAPITDAEAILQLGSTGTRAPNNDTSTNNTAPTTTIETVVTKTPSISPTTVDNMLFDRSVSDNNSNPEYWWAEDTGEYIVCVKNSNYPATEVLLFSSVGECCSANADACEPERQREHQQNPLSDRRRQLQTEKSGRFMIISHPLKGEVIYGFDSRNELSIQKHNFAAVGIARRPAYGNYNGGEGNSNDVLVWGSLRGGDARQGETVLFQLPKGFNHFNSSEVDVSQFQAHVLESVSWTTKTRPTFSASGLDVYFAISGNRFTGWNKGQQFDIVANLGPIPLPPETGDLNSAGRPIVLANDDKLLLLASTDHNTMFATNIESSGIIWTLDDMGTDSIFTTPRVSSDGAVAYFGKSNEVHAANVTDGSRLWGQNGYQHPFNAASDPQMVADFSLSSTGEFLYYARGGSAISAIKVAEVLPTDSPTFAPTTNSPTSRPSAMPSSTLTSNPSAVPSVALSSPPSESSSPTITTLPTVTSSPSKDPDWIPPSSSPTLTSLPSLSPSVSSSDSPSIMSSNVLSLPPSKATLTASPVATENITEEMPSSPPSDIPPNANPPSVAAEVPPNNSNDQNSPLSTTAIIGIAVGGGVGLILLLGIICYICKKKREEDDGVDTAWQQSNTANGNAGAEEGTTFQYGDEEGNQSRQQRGEGGSPLRW
ncbi:hypothetical protein ACHAXR_004005, partial [Thalassiosira sp. AJA248-18]